MSETTGLLGRNLDSWVIEQRSQSFQLGQKRSQTRLTSRTARVKVSANNASTDASVMRIIAPLSLLLLAILVFLRS